MYVSLCMPTFNGERYLRPAIESALAQEAGVLELVIVDDGSTDGTVEMVREFARRDRRVRLHENRERLGMAQNWNRAIELSGGEWVKFVFQDDLLTPACVGTMLRAANESGRSMVACRRHFVFDETVTEAFRTTFLDYVGAHDLGRIMGGDADLSAEQFADIAVAAPRGNWVGEPTAVMFRRSLVAQVGLFDPALRQLTDWDMWLRLASRGGIAYLDDPLVSFRLHGSSVTLANQRPESRGDALDALVLLYKLSTGEAYAPLRAAALRAHPAIRLDLLMEDEYVQIRRLCASTQSEALRAIWDAVARVYPALAPTPARDWGRSWTARWRRLRRRFAPNEAP